MNRRDLLKIAAAIPFAHCGIKSIANGAASPTTRGQRRVRPGDRDWPSAGEWDTLARRVGGRLLKLESPFDSGAPAASRTEALAHLSNPFYIGDTPALTQTSGWLDAWQSRPSAWAVAATSTADVVAAVNFARRQNVRLVVRGGGHSYQGTSDAPDSLLLWTRHMNRVELHDAFAPQGAAPTVARQPAVTLEAGAIWIDAYDAVTTRGGRYVQGGGCTTVGVAGLVQSGGFGSFSKAYGTAAAGLLEAEVVTADGVVRIANASTHPDLFWGLKGGGGGSLGVVTRLTLATHALPEFFGAVFFNVKAATPAAYRDLIARAVAFYRDTLFNGHWGEQISFAGDTLAVRMTFQGLTLQQAKKIWEPFLAWVRDQKKCAMDGEPRFVAIPARHFWDVDYLRQNLPGAVVPDARLGAPAHHVSYAQNGEEAGWFIHGYQSAWLPASLLDESRQPELVDAIFACTRHWPVALHFNKGLAGAGPEQIAAARQTATNPNVLTAFALAICAGGGPPDYPGMTNVKSITHLIDTVRERADAGYIKGAMSELLKVAPNAGAYLAESDYFQKDWQSAFWGANYPRLADVKRKYDPDGIFFVHHGVGSEHWSNDGFERSDR